MSGEPSSTLPVETPSVTNPTKSGGGGRKNRKPNDAEEGNDAQALTQGAKSAADSLVPSVGDSDEGNESLKIRIRLNLQAKVRVELDADIKGEVVIGLL